LLAGKVFHNITRCPTAGGATLWEFVEDVLKGNGTHKKAELQLSNKMTEYCAAALFDIYQSKQIT
jgi:hypothetical protein